MGTDKPKRKYNVSEKALAQRRNNRQIKAAETPEEFESNSRSIEHIMRIYQIAQTADRKDPVSLRAAFINYIRLCQEDGFPVLNMAAYAAMGVDRKVIHYWRKSENKEYKDLAEFVTSICALAREDKISSGKLNPVIGIFWQRNFDGLRNDTEQIQTVDDDQGHDGMTASEYRKKYGKLLEE